MSDRVESIFHEAKQLSKLQRIAFLQEACGDDKALLTEVEAMLDAHDQVGLSFESPTLATEANASSPTKILHAVMGERPGQTFGRYKLLQMIGEGGFGSVWMAEQREPVRRRVALKIIKLGMDTKQVIARFEAERQALAMMDHPHIAKVLDAGTTDAGRPYFVMEYIKGIPIMEYCDTERIETTTRLNLFIPICNAIQHAHQKGIIHRDIKPSNILITMHDGVPVPKVIDFGIAKAINTELTQKTLFTEHRQMIGTPAYMSPEQAEMSGLDIDTRSDIYSLGVLLYELLTGTTPFNNLALLDAGFAEMIRIIREQEPPRPSTRLSRLDDTVTRTARQRRADTKKLGTLLRGDLDWIVMKCLEKDRTRRYETANELASDIKRHLHDEPVIAGPPSRRYRIGKFVRRNRGQVIAAGFVTVALLVAIMGTSWGMIWALDERAVANQSAKKASELSNKYQNDMRAANDRERKAEAKANEEAAARRRAEMVAHDKTMEAEQLHKQVIEILKQTKGDDHIDTARAITALGQFHYDSHRLNEAAEIFEQSLPSIRQSLGDEHPETLSLTDTLGVIYTVFDKHEQAERLLERTLEIRKRVTGPEHRDTLATTVHLANLYRATGRVDAAISMLEQTLQIQKRVLGEEKPATLNTTRALAVSLIAAQRYDRAERMLDHTLTIQTRDLGIEHFDTLRTINDLGDLYLTQKRFAKASWMFREGLPAMRRKLGTPHFMTRDAMHKLSIASWECGLQDQAKALASELVDLRLGDADATDADAETLDSVAQLLLGHPFEFLRDPNMALAYSRRACLLEQESGGKKLASYQITLAIAQHRTGDRDAAAHTLRRAWPSLPLQLRESSRVKRLVKTILGSESAQDLDLSNLDRS